ncbi:helix-turn-helix transcriptional regulator [Achromobacter sp. SIMBA_011]|uniref:AraC family transcriptional regulator n=1 Tax=Achromobacter TaxID=222 RepID=UPI00047BE18C|nr:MULTISPECIES: helix-turn-helix transcriptional regulator [Achromobacter]MCH4594015.1 helix-turn-helix transcriptional regulator [Achromobacter xylosoxidans]MDC6161732.1 helix-turn-helix transcriptional regulator [Achromobacter xylosoxidans]OAS81963.1 AraC family transcriptional regulator [Achromobacter xylosoxidans]CUI50625.1 HTH-type transcriptional repressor of iron proteins A [Achromobacter xylosoxidans]CUJ22811.1 HTH-type transcriptional repressor of iron proteins A [Achromobacter dolen
MSRVAITDLTVPRDVDSVSRPVVALSATSVRKDWENARHQHRKAQLIYSVRGILNCEIEDGVWIVPPQCAIWIPGDLPHAARGAGETECYCLFVEPDATPDLPKDCCTISVSPLLRELLLRAAGFPELYPLGGREDRLIAALLDELVEAPVEDLHLPMPRDTRLRRLAQMMLADPTDKTSKADWAIRIGMSERSMSRLLLHEIGMSFGRWRRQLHVILALQRLTKGESVQTVALELGYENASGFVTMFRKAMGKPPARYLSDRLNGEALAGVPGITLPD